MYQKFCSSRSIALLAVLFLAQAGLSYANGRTPELRVCLYNFADVNAPTLASMQSELSELFYPGRVSLEQAPCPPSSGRVVYLVLREGSVGKGNDALGRAAVAKGRILPVLEVYVRPLIGLIGQARSSTKVGRALARVTAHEVTHYIRQDPKHIPYGLMRSGFSGRELAEEDSYPFLRR